MNRAFIIKVIHSYFGQLKNHYTGIERHLDPEAIHQFRVEYKKLRAFLRLLQFRSRKKIRLPKSLKKVYAKSGLVREFQILLSDPKALKRISLHGSAPVKQQLRTAARELERVMRPGLLQDAEKKLVNELPDILEEKTINNFFRDNMEKAKTLVSTRGSTDEQLHDLRKIMKDLLYNAQLLRKETDQVMPSNLWNRRREKYYEKATHELGDYHDAVVHAQQSVEIPGIHSLNQRTWTYQQFQSIKWKRALVKNLGTNLFLKYPLSPGVVAGSIL